MALSGVSLRKLVVGTDGWASTSKLQLLLWVTVIVFAYSALWVLRVEEGNYSAVGEAPVNLLVALAFSTSTTVAAKGITSAYVQTNRVSKRTTDDVSDLPARAAPGILKDDRGSPDWAKAQLMGFTLLTIAIFLASVIHQIASNPPDTILPDIDTSLLIVIVISQIGYLGKKLVTFGSPTLYAPEPSEGPSGAVVTLSGASLGKSPVGKLLKLNGKPIPFSLWSDSAIEFTVPSADPRRNAAWVPPQKVQIAVVASGQVSNPVTFTVTGETNP